MIFAIYSHSHEESFKKAPWLFAILILVETLAELSTAALIGGLL